MLLPSVFRHLTQDPETRLGGKPYWSTGFQASWLTGVGFYCGPGTLTGQVFDTTGENVTGSYPAAVANYGLTTTDTNGPAAVEWYRGVSVRSATRLVMICARWGRRQGRGRGSVMGAAARLQEQPGVKAYSVAATDNEILSLSVWDTRENAEAGNAAVADWVGANMAGELTNAESVSPTCFSARRSASARSGKHGHADASVRLRRLASLGREPARSPTRIGLRSGWIAPEPVGRKLGFARRFTG